MASTPRHFPTSGFASLGQDERIEEETLPSYAPEDYYPAYIGEMFDSRYQIVSKLGFGVNSTVWLCRDFRHQRYLTLKLRTRSKDSNYVNPGDDGEVLISRYLDNKPIEHPGRGRVRTIVDSFEVAGPHGNHKCLLYQPLGMSFADFARLTSQNNLPKDLVQKSVQLLLIALDYLHKCDVVHTDISPNNVLQAIPDNAVLSQIEQSELDRPIARKILSDRTIYNSRYIPWGTGKPVLCDLGEAQSGTQKHSGDIMPDIYRAPEVILGMEWDSKVDIWAVGVMTWDLLEGRHLFFAKKDRLLDDEQHLAELVSLLGPPPKEFLRRSDKCCQYWDDQGNWKGSVPIPDQSFETREQCLHSEERGLFTQFMRKVLCWTPEQRPTAEELAFDDFLMRP